MKFFKKAVGAIGFLILAAGSLHAQDLIELTLEECILRAVENNLEVAVEVLNPELADISVSLAGEMFYPEMALSFGTQNTTTPSFSWIDAANEVTSDFMDYQAQVSQLIPTGGTLAVSLYSYSSETNMKFQTINPRYGSQLSFQFTQPLLKDFGFRVTRREIILAKNNREISENQFKESLMDIIYDVEEAYWNLVYSRRNLEALQQSLNLARDLLSKNRREVELGTLAPIEIKAAEAEVAIREADILQAELLVQNSEDILLTLLNLQNTRDFKGVVPVDTPHYDVVEPNIEQAFRMGVRNRPDLERYRLLIRSNQLDLGYARNQLLPELNLRASYWSPGISGTRILYLNNNPLTEEVVGAIPGQSADSFREALQFRYNNWALGVTLSIPITSVFSRAQLAQAKVNLDQSRLQLESSEQQAFLEIRNAVRTVQTNFKRVDAYRAARVLAQDSLAAEEKKLKVGLSTNYQVLQYQRDLANARSSELRAVIDYTLSLAHLEKVTGMSLIKKNITLRPSGGKRP